MQDPAHDLADAIAKIRSQEDETYDLVGTTAGGDHSGTRRERCACQYRRAPAKRLEHR